MTQPMLVVKRPHCEYMDAYRTDFTDFRVVASLVGGRPRRPGNLRLPRAVPEIRMLAGGGTANHFAPVRSGIVDRKPTSP
ncbi:MAG: hypothetical protein OEW94_16525, partial [Betaproteobacteria bacterium]|nr:hypothetical protein [Betaproteobacteria bacterium]